jgi:hypothetical protein
MSRLEERLRDGFIAGSVAAVVSGAPSTLHAIATGRSPLEATLAAGSMLAPNGNPRTRLVAALPVHMALSLGWGVLLSFTLPRRRGLLWGAAAGAGIAALDLGVFGRFWPEVRDLPPGPQVADHVAYGATVGAVRARRNANKATAPSVPTAARM